MGYSGKYDFCGWATKNNLKCADGRVIRQNAFSVDDGKKVPLVWNHEHNDPSKILGHAYLENRDEGVYAYALFNDTPRGRDAKEAVKHGDVESLSIWANNLEQNGNDVIHGVIREVSLVLAGSNPGAYVESVMSHGEPIDETDFEGIFYTGDNIVLSHAEEGKPEDNKKKEENKNETEDGKSKSGENNSGEKEKEKGIDVKKAYNSMTEEQKLATAIIANEMVAEANKKGGKEMAHNIFDNEDNKNKQTNDNVISHSMLNEALEEAKQTGSLKEAIKNKIGSDVLIHSIPTAGMTVSTGTSTYGINDPEMLFPDFKSLNNPPEFISRNMSWVQKVISRVHRTPFSRIKSVFADITEDEARAKGYIKGKQKKSEVFSILKRTTDAQTVYKHQAFDRDDILDITDFDVIPWIKAEMEMMLDEEIARAILIGDGREPDAEDKIKSDRIRPIVTDVALFNVMYSIDVTAAATPSEVAKATIDAAIKSRKKYKGSGNPTFYTTEDVLTDMLLLEDKIGHKLYKTEAELATALRVSEIVTVEPMEGYTININSSAMPLMGVIVNLNDYNVGTNRNAGKNFFNDFDIDFNKYKYLLETRFSGALVKPFSAITLVKNTSGSSVIND